MNRLWRNWTTHNLIAHPLAEVAWLFGLDEWSRIIHDTSAPEDQDPRRATHAGAGRP